MLRVGLHVLLGGVGVAYAGERKDCQDNSTCRAQAEDLSMLQFANKGLRLHEPSRAFVLNSKPFISPNNADLVGAEQGALIIDEDGEMNTYYLPGATIIDGGKTVKYTPPYRFYLMKRPTTDYSNADNFYKPNFKGKTFSVDINFGNDGPACGCNLNFYMVDMPVGPAGKDGDHYCDAQCFPGLGCCSEFDMNEGNMDVQQMTNHACTNDYGDHPDWACHKWGDPEEKTHGNEFGPGSQYTINSQKPFTFSQKFDVNGDDFTFTTTMAQEGRTVVKPMGPGSSQLNAMWKVLDRGMAFVTGYWFATDMNWMDGELCGSGSEHCNMNPAFLSNWRLTSGDGPVPSPSPSPSPSPPSPSPTPPAPTPPAPTPPAPAPTQGKCCWGGMCSNCKEDAGDWCNQGAANCWQCKGGWCPGR